MEHDDYPDQSSLALWRVWPGRAARLPVSFFSEEVSAKRLGLLHELPKGVLNPPKCYGNLEAILTFADRKSVFTQKFFLRVDRTGKRPCSQRCRRFGDASPLIGGCNDFAPIQRRSNRIPLSSAYFAPVALALFFGRCCSAARSCLHAITRCAHPCPHVGGPCVGPGSRSSHLAKPKGRGPPIWAGAAASLANEDHEAPERQLGRQGDRRRPHQDHCGRPQRELRSGPNPTPWSAAGPLVCPQCDTEQQREADAERQRKWEGWREGQRIGRKEYEP
jgi:hypothetical protein